MPKMLIVDDDLYLRKLVLTYAQLENFQCSEAENSSQALELIRNMQELCPADAASYGKEAV